MKCPECGQDNPLQAKFCEECGTARPTLRKLRYPAVSEGELLLRVRRAGRPG